MEITEMREAQRIMMEFVQAHVGEDVKFNSLNDEEKFAYVMVKSFKYFAFLNLGERYKRTIRNTENHRKNDFYVFANNGNEHMKIQED